MYLLYDLISVGLNVFCGLFDMIYTGHNGIIKSVLGILIITVPYP